MSSSVSNLVALGDTMPWVAKELEKVSERQIEHAGVVPAKIEVCRHNRGIRTNVSAFQHRRKRSLSQAR